ncbi:LapA family protein [Gammaproteobacteria bacterium]|nr:LapA family protein [Gammaproteobacteria bacterium]
MRIFRYVILLVVIFLGVTFALLNKESVLINYYFGSGYIPLSFLLVIVFVIASLLGLIVGLWLLLKLKLKVYKLQQQLKAKDKQIDNLNIVSQQDNH